MNIANGGKSLEVADTHVVALYDPASGRIAHVHTVTVFKGGRAVTEKEAIEAAQAQARRSGLHVEGLKVKVSRSVDHGRSPHKIDLSSGDFVPLPAPGRAR